MKSSREDIILLENYLKNNLTPQEKSEVESRLVSEADLAYDLENLKFIVKAARVTSLAEKHEFLKSLENRQKTTLDSATWKKWLLFIIIFLLLGYLSYEFALKGKSRPDGRYKGIYASDFDKQLILHETLRSTVQIDSLSPEQRRAYELYSLQLFDEAAPLLQALWQEKKDTLALFYLGVSRIGMGQTKEGLKILQQQELSGFKDQKILFFNQ